MTGQMLEDAITHRQPDKRIGVLWNQRSQRDWEATTAQKEPARNGDTVQDSFHEIDVSPENDGKSKLE